MELSFHSLRHFARKTSTSGTLHPRTLVNRPMVNACNPFKWLVSVYKPNRFKFFSLAQTFDGRFTTLSLTSTNPASSISVLYSVGEGIGCPIFLHPSKNRFDHCSALLSSGIESSSHSKPGSTSCISRYPPGLRALPYFVSYRGLVIL